MLKIQKFHKVYVPSKIRDPFLSQTYLSDYIPDPRPEFRFKKPKQSGWTDPDVVWPPIMPPPVNLKPKKILREIAEEEHIKQRFLKTWKYPKFKTGDLISFHKLHSLSEGGGNKFTGVCTQVKSQNSLNGSFSVVTKVAGDWLRFRMFNNSPYVADFKLEKQGRKILKNNITKTVWAQSNFDYTKPIMGKKKKKRQRTHADNLAYVKKKKGMLLDKKSIV